MHLYEKLKTIKKSTLGLFCAMALAIVCVIWAGFSLLTAATQGLQPGAQGAVVALHILGILLSASAVALLLAVAWTWNRHQNLPAEEPAQAHSLLGLLVDSDQLRQQNAVPEQLQQRLHHYTMFVIYPPRERMETPGNPKIEKDLLALAQKVWHDSPVPPVLYQGGCVVVEPNAAEEAQNPWQRMDIYRETVNVSLDVTPEIYYNENCLGADTLQQSYVCALCHPAYKKEDRPNVAPQWSKQEQSKLELQVLLALKKENYGTAYAHLKAVTAYLFACNFPPKVLETQLLGLSSTLFVTLSTMGDQRQSDLQSLPWLCLGRCPCSEYAYLLRWAEIFKSYEGHGVPLESGGSVKFQKFYDHVQQNFRYDQLSLNSVAQVFSVSPATVTREFKKNTDMGFLEYLHRLRIAAAKQEICSSDRPLKEIATKVGYSNVLTMARAFKKYEGESPSTLRKMGETDV